MIITQIKGGLGNQLFQYALGRRLAFDHRCPLKLDVSWYETQEKRRFELNKFGIPINLASEEEVRSIRIYSRNPYVNKVFTTIGNRLPYWKRRVITERLKGVFDKNIIDAPKDCYLQGYWQSEKYFNSIGNLIKRELLQFQFSPNYQALSLEMSRDPNSVSIHVRRGDYVSENTGHYVCPQDYFQKAIDYFGQQCSNLHFYIFSDDIEWTKANFNIKYPSVFITPNNNSVFDLQLMSCCNHHINSNSSFSWWGAWLGEKDRSIVIVPNRWYQNQIFISDMVPQRWRKL